MSKNDDNQGNEEFDAPYTHLTSFFILCGRLEYKILNIIFIRKRIRFLHVRLSIECFLEVKPDHLDLGPVEDPVQGGEEKISEDPINILTQPARNLITYQPWEEIINIFLVFMWVYLSFASIMFPYTNLLLSSTMVSKATWLVTRDGS